MNKTLHIIFSILVMMLFSCASEKSFSQSPGYCTTNRFTDVVSFDSSHIVIDTNVVYGIAVNSFTGVNDTLLMNVFYPDTIADTMTARPFILLFHGGAFLGGSRHDMDYQCMEFAKRGFVTATIDYRLGWNCAGTDYFSICLLCGNSSADMMTATYEAAQDGRAAMRFIDAHHLHYKIDPAAYFIGGTSAGSITAMHTAFWDQQEANSFCPWAAAQAGLLDNSGNSLPSNYQIQGVIDNCGAITKDSAALNNGNIPMISFHDEGDCIVPNQYGQVISCTCQVFYWVAGSSVLHNLFAANQICTSMNLVPLSINHCSFPEYELVNRASCFIRSVLCNQCQVSYNNTPYVPEVCSAAGGIADMTSSALQYLYPNPAGEEFFIPDWSGNNCNVSVTDATGKIIRRFVLHSGESRCNVAGTAQGLYFVRVQTENAVHFYKLIR